MEKLDGWLFTYNPHIKQWMATTRDNKDLLFSDHKNKAVLRSYSINTLIDIILKPSLIKGL